MENTSFHNTSKPFMGFNSMTLKTIAIIAMLIDHIAYAFVPYGTVPWAVMDLIGKITGPTMFYFAVEGYHHTKNLKKYLLRLFVFAVISYFPFMLFIAGGNIENLNFFNFNVIYTILLGVIAVHIRRKVKNPVLKWALILMLICMCVPADWGTKGIIIIILFDYFYGNFHHQAFAYSLVVLLEGGVLSLLTHPIIEFVYEGKFNLNIDLYMHLAINLGMFLPLILLKFYNGKLGTNKKSHKMFFYIFYPLHLLVIGLIKMFL